MIKKPSFLLRILIMLVIWYSTILQRSFPQQTGSQSQKDTTRITVTGIIRDRRTGEALPYASVLLKGTKVGAMANTDGAFTLFNVPKDSCTLTASYIGYKNKEIFVISSQLTSRIQIELDAIAVELHAVTIEAETEDIMEVSGARISTVKMSPKQLAILPNAGDKDIMRAFQLMPGISASNENSSGLYVRGGTPDQNLIVYDGFTVYHVDHLYGFYSAFNSSAVKDVQLYKGGFDSKFGGRLSSVTEITGKDGDSKQTNIKGNVTLMSADALLEGPIGRRITYLLAFRRSWEGGIYSKIFDKYNTDETNTPQIGGGRPGIGPSFENTVSSYFYDLNAKLTYHPSEDDIISLSLYNGTDNLDNGQSPEFGGGGPFGGGGTGGGSLEINDLTNYGNFGSGFKWSRKWTPEIYGTTLISFSNYYSDRDRSNSGTITTSDGSSRDIKTGTIENNDLYDYSFKTDFQYDISQISQYGFGAFATSYDISYSFAQNDTVKILDRKNTGGIAGGYLQTTLKYFDELLSVTPGLRATWFEGTEDIYLEPRFSAQYHYTDEITFRFASGLYYQFANRITREDILSGSRDFWILADGKRVPVSSAIHYIAGTSYETGGYLFSAEAYYKIMDNLSEYSLRYTPSFQQRALTYEENFFTGSGYARGIEFLAQKKYGKFSGWMSYTLGQARNHFDVYSSSDYPANQDVTHEFKIVSMYSWKQWDFSATWIFATGRPYTAPLGAYTVTLLDGTTQDYYTVGDKNSFRFQDYHRLDAAVTYKFIDEDNKREIGSIGVSLFNLYDRKNAWYKEFQIVEGEIIETNINYLGFTPNIMLSLSF